MRRAVLLLLLCAPAYSQEGARKKYYASLRRIYSRQQRILRNYRREWRKDVRSIRRELDMELSMQVRVPARIDRAYKQYLIDREELVKRHYDMFLGIERARVDAAKKYAASGHENALVDLFVRLMEAVSETNRIVAAMRTEPDVDLPRRRHAIELRKKGLVSALQGFAGFVDHTQTSGLAKAKRRDKGKSVAHQVAVIDALGTEDDGAAVTVLRPLLVEKDFRIRIAALREGRVEIDRIAGLLQDPHGAVRRALLKGIAAHAKGRSAWLPPLVGFLAGSGGWERAQCVRLLETLSSERLGDDAEGWAAWLAKHQKSIEDGSFRPPKAAGPLSKAPVRFRLYGIASPSDGCVVLIEGTWHLKLPAHWAVDRRHSLAWWKWTRGPRPPGSDSHQRAIADAIGTAFRRADPAVRCNVALVREGWRPQKTMLSGRKLFAARRSARRAEALVREYGNHRAMNTSLLEDVMTRIAGKGRAGTADTCYLFSTGRFGSFELPEAAAADFVRRNRFRQWIVHTIQISGGHPSQVGVMAAIAKGCGGTFFWAQSPPAD